MAKRKKTIRKVSRFRKWKRESAEAGYFREKTTGKLLKRAEGVMGKPRWDTDRYLGYVYCTYMIGGTEGALICCQFEDLEPLTEMDVIAWAAE